MDYRIRRFGIHSTALTVATMYFILALVIVPFLYLATRNAPGQALPGFMFVVGPFFYAAMGYVIAAIGCWIYNNIAGRVGGITLTLEPEGAGDRTA